jgi:beta-lactamase class C
MIEDGTSYAVLRDKLKEVQLTEAPGKVHSYQNIAYSLISDILEKITGKTYETLLKEEIFTPLGMNDASASFNDLIQSTNHAEPHITTRKGFVTVKNTAEYYTVLPAAGVNASITDMANWLLALTGNKPAVISPTIINEIFTPQIVTPKRRKYFFMRWLPVKKTYYGMGWRILNYDNDTIAYHGGYVKGYRAEIAIIPGYDLGIVVLCNAPGKFINNAIPTFLDLFFKYKETKEEKKGETGENVTIPFIYRELKGYNKAGVLPAF